MSRIFRLVIEACPKLRRAQQSPRSGPGSRLLFRLFLLGWLLGGFSFGLCLRGFSFGLCLGLSNHFHLFRRLFFACLRGFRDGFFLRRRLSLWLRLRFGFGL
ncbi:MAG: hypothetical protein V3W35_10080, partial [Gemmatimonadota bacterium]